jgi:F-type H+-transporting ATPase subunit epsilon
MYLEIVTPEASLVSGEVESVTVPGVQGPFQMLNNHAPIVSLLDAGKVKFRGNPTIAEGFEDKFTKEKDGKWSMEISSGTVELNNNRIIVLAD